VIKKLYRSHAIERATSGACAFALGFVLILGMPCAALAQKPAVGPLKVFISVDMEGIAGVVTADQLGPQGFEYERFRHFMTNETLAAVRAAKAAGATEILIADAHGNGENLLIEEFPRDVRIIRSWPRRGGMMGGLDASFSAAIMIGYHASASSSAGVRAHTVSSATFTRIAINGQDVSEGAIGAAQAGAMGVPVVFMSGDNVAIAELRDRIGNIVGVETKKALGFHSAETIPPAESVARIEASVRSALARVHEFKPYVVTVPITVELSYKNYAAAEIFSYLPGMERVGSRTIRYVGKNIEEVVDLITVAESYQPDASP
jgi:D-amino peptidase